MSIDDLLASLPPEMLEESRPLTPDSDEGGKQEEKDEEPHARTLRKRKQPSSSGDTLPHDAAKSTKQQVEKKV